MSKNKFSREQKKTILKFRNIGIRAFMVLLLVGCVMGFLFFLRPDTSEVEKRKLTEFPKFTIASFMDGSFFSDVSLWYSDTFPMRDTLIAADKKIKSLYGVTSSTMMVGGHEQGDDIPTLDDSSKKEEEDSEDESIEGQALTEDDEIEEGEKEEKKEKKEPVQAPDSTKMEAEIQNQIQKGLYVKGSAAYSVYYFNQDSVTTYIDALNKAADKLDGKANVYSLLVPNNSGAMLSEKELKGLGGSDQIQAIDYYYGQYDKVKSIDTIKTLRKHNDEYLYFRTDHHWTQLGAYYVYRNFCKEKGWKPHELSDFETMEFSPFLGTFYATLRNKDMADDPDSVTAYIPNGTNEMTYWNKDGSKQEWKVITDVSKWDSNSGYYCYIGGDKPMSVIENPEITDGSSCLVLKESYGNCFVPFLVDHYQTVYVVDFRYANVNVVDYVKEKGIQDLIIMNNITIIGSKDVAATIAGLL